MRRAFVFLFSALLAAPAISDTECPKGYGYVQYERLEYIESTGTQWIGLPYGFDNTDEIEIKTKLLNLGDDKYLLAPKNWNTNGNRFAMAGSIRNARNIGYGGNSTDGTTYSPPIIPLKGQVAVERYKNKLFTYIEGTTVVDKDVSSVFFGGPTDALRLFFGYSSNTAGVIYYFKQTKANGDKLNLVPVRRVSDKTVGMYDLVEGKFYGNDGTGEFIAGPEVLDVDISDGMCSICPPNTYKDFVGNSECTSCPNGLISPSGSTSADDCGRVLWVGDKIFIISSAPRTAHTLNVMDSEGNIFYGNLYSEQ